MAEETRSLKTSSEKNLETLNKLHLSNYDIFRAKSEEDVLKAIKATLKLSPFVSGYYTVTGAGFRLVAMTKPTRGDPVSDAPLTVPISAAEIAAKFSEGYKQVSLDDNSDLPSMLVDTLKNAGSVKAAYIPVIESVETIGVFVFGATEKQVLDEQILESFISLADLLPSAIDKVKATRVMRQRLREMESITMLGQHMSTASDVNALYKIIHQQVRDIVGETIFLVALFDRKLDVIRVPYRFENGRLSSIEGFPRGEELISVLLDKLQPIMLVEDAETKASELGVKGFGKAIKSWLGCPLIVAGEAIGAIVVQDTAKEHSFDQDDLRKVTALSYQAAGAIYNALSLGETQQRALQLETAAEIARDVSETLIVDDLIKKSVELIGKKFDFNHAAFFLVDPAGEYAVIKEATGNIGSQMKAAGHRLMVGSSSIIGQVTAKGQPFIVNDTTRSPIHKANPLLPDTRSEVGIPIRVGQRIIGALDVQSIKRYAFTDESVKILQLVADQIAIGFVKSGLFSEAQQRLHEMEALSTLGQQMSTASDVNALYKIIHQQVRDIVGETIFLVALFDRKLDVIRVPYRFENGRLSSIEGFPRGEELIDVLLTKQQPIMLVEDAETKASELGVKGFGKAIKSWLGCPLIVAGEAIGAIVVQDTAKEHSFDQDDLRKVTALSYQAAGAIYNALSLGETQQRALQLETAAEIARDVSETLIVDDLLKKSVELIGKKFDFYHAAIFLVDPTGEFAFIREASGNIGAQMKASGHRVMIGSSSIIGQVTAKGQPFIVNDTTRSPIHKANPLLPDTRSEVGIPIRVGQRIIGALDVQSIKRYAFTDENLRILQLVSDQIAIGFVNSELFAEAQERLSQHRLLHSVTTAAASTTTLEEALNNTVRGLQVTMGGDQISILLSDRENKTLEIKAAIGITNGEIFSTRIPFGSGISGWVAEQKQSLRINDVSLDPRYLNLSDKVRSELAIPLIYRNEVLGVLNVESTRPNAYSENDEEMLGTLAGSLAAIIAHSRLLEQFRQQVELDRLLLEVTTKIRRASNINAILETTANELNKAIGARRTRIKVDLTGIENSPAPVSAKK